MMLLDEDGNEAPREAYERHARKVMLQAGLKLPGRRKKQETIGDVRRALRGQGHTPEEIASAHGVEIETVLRTTRPSRAKRGGQ